MPTEHKTNILAFIEAAKSTDALLSAYCGLVAIELCMKSKVPLKDHNVCAGLEKFRHLQIGTSKAYSTVALTSMTNALRSAINNVRANDRNGNPRRVPAESYPYIRYTRIMEDGWPSPHSTLPELKDLADLVKQLRAFIKVHFSLII